MKDVKKISRKIYFKGIWKFENFENFHKWTNYYNGFSWPSYLLMLGLQYPIIKLFTLLCNRSCNRYIPATSSRWTKKKYASNMWGKWFKKNFISRCSFKVIHPWPTIWLVDGSHAQRNCNIRHVSSMFVKSAINMGTLSKYLPKVLSIKDRYWNKHR